MGPKLQVTKDYSLFDPHEFNRPLHEKPELKNTAALFYQPGRNLVDARKFHISLRELRGLTRPERRR